MNMSKEQSITVALPPMSDDRSYPIYIGSGLLSDAELWQSYLKSAVCVVTNQTIATHYLDPFWQQWVRIGGDNRRNP